MGKVMIWGLPRSGTSLTAAMVERYGLDMGLMVSDVSPHSPTGTKECPYIMQLNTQIMYEYGGGLFDPVPIPLTRKFRKKIVDTVGTREAFKITRPVPHLYERALDLKIIVVRRALDDWLQAIARYAPNISTDTLMRMVNLYAKVERGLKSPRITVWFGDLVRRPNWVSQQIGEFLGLDPLEADDLIKTRW